MSPDVVAAAGEAAGVTAPTTAGAALPVIDVSAGVAGVVAAGRRKGLHATRVEGRGAAGLQHLALGGATAEGSLTPGSREAVAPLPGPQVKVGPGEGPVTNGHIRPSSARQKAAVGQGPAGPTVPVLEEEEAPLVAEVGARGRVGGAALGAHVPCAARVVVATAPGRGPSHLVRADDRPF